MTEKEAKELYYKLLPKFKEMMRVLTVNTGWEKFIAEDKLIKDRLQFIKEYLDCPYCKEDYEKAKGVK